MKKKNMLIILVFLLTIGFASVSTTLVMNGTVGIAKKTSDFNVIFTSAIVNGNNEAKATISENKKTITFETDKLSVVGDSAELVYKVKNNSTQYDANVIVSCTGGNEEYLSINGEFAGKSLPLTTPELMEAQEVRMGIISVELTKTYGEGVTKEPLTCKIEVEGEERDTIANPSTCNYSDGTVWTFDYTGGKQEFEVPCDGEYKFETWGAQGATDSDKYYGGYGGYSKGNYSLQETKSLYVFVGGKGLNINTSNDLGTVYGYPNGGAVSVTTKDTENITFSSGGGSTHILLENKDLKDTSISNVLIVAAGGGGACDWWSWGDNGGNGGGYIGGTTTRNFANQGVHNNNPTGGTQTSGGNGGGNLDGFTADSNNQGVYGIGGGKNVQSLNVSGGGGGGLYGGGASWGGSGAGGSSYIGNPNLTNKAMYCYNCQTSNDESTKTISNTCVSTTPTEKCSKQGNGYAKITLVSAKYPKNEYKETILNGTDPVIKNGLIPVTIENDGIVKKADTSSEWYNYENKEWANAVILSDETINYNDGDTIPESNIESYFVWIPRYKYQIFDEGNYTEVINSKPTESIAKEIQIEFENKDNAPSNGNIKDSWLTHPAFTNFGVNGLWVGKFETTGSQSNVTVKPEIKSLTNLNVKTMFNTAYNYNRNLDSHMMKNTEWGAVAYLSHSKYGINKEVNINNNSNKLTGYSAVEETDQSSYPGIDGTDATKTLAYNTSTGYMASTTGNITGVYDMSGGVYEYMASYMDGYGVKSSGNVASGFTDTELNTYAKYLDKYSNTSTTTAWNNRILGDATGEMGPFYRYKDNDNAGNTRNHNNWYADASYFVDSTKPWFDRGGNYHNGVLCGQFLFVMSTGASNENIGFRLVLV